MAAGAAVKGPILSGLITFYAFGSGTPTGCSAAVTGTPPKCALGTATTDAADGSFQINLNSTISGPILAEVTSGTFVDFATGNTISLSATNLLRSVISKVPADGTIGNLGISVLTTIAAQRF